MKTIWISRDSSNDDLQLWTSPPEVNDNGIWNGGNHEFAATCDSEIAFIIKLLGESWVDKGSFCVEIQIASVKRVLGARQKLAETLTKMTKASFNKATIDEAAKLLDK